jgi:hypothetical protein
MPEGAQLVGDLLPGARLRSMLCSAIAEHHALVAQTADAHVGVTGGMNVIMTGGSWPAAVMNILGMTQPQIDRWSQSKVLVRLEGR